MRGMFFGWCCYDLSMWQLVSLHNNQNSTETSGIWVKKCVKSVDTCNHVHVTPLLSTQDMLGTNCRHSGALPSETSENSLLEICFDYINLNLETIWVHCKDTGRLELRQGVALPMEICERLLNVRSNSLCRVNRDFINIFRDRLSTRLKRVKLRDTDVTDHYLEILLQHKLVELEITHCAQLSSQCVQHLNSYGSTFARKSGENDTLFLPQTLRRLALRNVNMSQEFFAELLKQLTDLNPLDLSNCSDLYDLKYVEHLTGLTSLILYNVAGIDLMVSSICQLKSLTHLDINQASDDSGKFKKASEILSTLVESLLRLCSLDISGTNLAGRGVAEVGVRSTESRHLSDIPGLSSRMGNPFQYLGLSETSHDACLRHDIPTGEIVTKKKNNKSGGGEPSSGGGEPSSGGGEPSSGGGEPSSGGGEPSSGGENHHLAAGNHHLAAEHHHLAAEHKEAEGNGGPEQSDCPHIAAIRRKLMRCAPKQHPRLWCIPLAYHCV